MNSKAFSILLISCSMKIAAIAKPENTISLPVTMGFRRSENTTSLPVTMGFRRPENTTSLPVKRGFKKPEQTARSLNKSESTIIESTTEYYQSLRRALGINSKAETKKQRETLVVEPGSAEEILDRVSKAFRQDLEELQSPPDCSKTPTLSCGHVNDCGLTCQIHHRAACVMYSYALRVPLIHEEKKYWPFTKPWTSAFLPIGSKCKRNNNTVKMNWNDPSYIHKKRQKPNERNPLKNGLPIRKDLAEIVEKFHPSPFLWWVGQFIKYVMRLSPTLSDLVETRRKDLKKYRSKTDSSQVVGLHIRKTDKTTEVAYANHTIKDYMDPADQFFKKYHRFERKSKTVMVATDDASIMKEIKAKYRKPEWNVFPVNPYYTKTLDNQKLRKHVLLETLTDFLLLSEADYIVCGFASNVCRLLLEIKVASHLNATESFKSVDDGYCFGLSGVYCPEVVVKV